MTTTRSRGIGAASPPATAPSAAGAWHRDPLTPIRPIGRIGPIGPIGETERERGIGPARWPVLPGLLVAMLLFAAPAVARPRARDAPKRTVVHFGGDTIEGTLMRPDEDLFSARPRLHLPSLVKPPKSFARASRQDLLNAANAVKER